MLSIAAADLRAPIPPESMKGIILATGMFCFGVGIAVLWTNPRRFTNQVMLFLSLLSGCWLWTVYGAIHAGEPFWRAPNQVSLATAQLPVPWLRANGACSVLLAYAIWLLHASILTAPGAARRTLRRSLPMLLACVPFLIICLSDWYIPADSTPLQPKRGVGYYVCLTADFLVYGWMLVRAAREMRRQNGLRRVEMQFLTLNFAITFLGAITLAVLVNVFDIIELRRTRYLVFLASFLLAAWALSFHRIFDARQIVLLLVQRMTLVLTGAAAVWGGWQLLGTFLPAPVDFVVSLAVCGSAALWLDHKSRQWLRLGSERTAAELRATIIGIARTAPDSERLVVAFEHLLRNHFGAASAMLILASEETVPVGRQPAALSTAALAKLTETGWCTPESIERRRSLPALAEITQFLANSHLGAIIAVPRGTSSPTLLVALGAKASGWPYTYHDIQCLQAAAELMDNILTRSRLTEQAALQAKMEHLSTMSRGLAHDLKNLITPISSYLVHTKGRGEAGGAEEEVHAAAQRSVAVMTDYIRQAAFFANELTPRWQSVNLAQLCDAVHEQAAPHAARRGVMVELDVADVFLVADAVLLQRLLANLINNAIDASRAGDRIVLRSGLPRAERIRLQVIDEGCGIPAENLDRIFEPYFTTKEFGEEVRGFGLGLSICQKIVQLHGGAICVESEVGRGTTFTIELRCGASPPEASTSISSPPPACAKES